MIEHIIIGRRKTGRTSTLIELCAEAEARGEVSYILTHNHESAYAIKQRAEERGLYIGFPLTYEEFLCSQGRMTNVFIDNADKLLEYLASRIHADVKAIVLEKGESD